MAFLSVLKLSLFRLQNVIEVSMHDNCDSTE